MDRYIASLVQYGIDHKLVDRRDRTYIINRLLSVLKLDSYTDCYPERLPLEEILESLLDDAVKRGVCDDGITARDQLDSALMGVLTPRPSEVIDIFGRTFAQDAKAATDWYYRFSQDTNYIRTQRIKKDVRWKSPSAYGALDISINLSKPEKDPKAIAAAKAAPQSGYPQCQLCAQNEGYEGRIDHPARQNHRIIPIVVDGQMWYLQYSPYVYYNEHCIVFNSQHIPMAIDDAVFYKLLDFVKHFPHYFVGSNADLPIVGGSILSHEHFQGGCYSFPMERAPVGDRLVFRGFADVEAYIVHWPMSVLRLRSKDRDRLAKLAGKILRVWRGYTDADAFVFAETDGTPHNTITPIARRRGKAFELDLVLRNNITTEEHPMGVYHPHKELHHIKKENIGLIEVMGLAVLPARLKKELSELRKAILQDLPLTGELEKHADWVAELKQKHTFTKENTTKILRQEVGAVFARVLEHAGVFFGKPDAFARFVDAVNKEDP